MGTCAYGKTKRTQYILQQRRKSDCLEIARYCCIYTDDTFRMFWARMHDDSREQTENR